MEDLKTLDTTQLFDMLSKYTGEYTKMLIDGTTEEDYSRYNLTIKALQTEIEVRNKSVTITPNSETNITKPPDFTT